MYVRDIACIRVNLQSLYGMWTTKYINIIINIKKSCRLAPARQLNANCEVFYNSPSFDNSTPYGAASALASAKRNH